jgi:hypothetical protein
MRLAILSEEVRDQIFSEVAAIIATDRADELGLSGFERTLLAEETELRLRALDRFHVARLLASSYAEGRRFMGIDELMEVFGALAAEERKDPGREQGRPRRLDTLRAVLNTELSYLEQIFPKTAGTHDRDRSLLR